MSQVFDKEVVDHLRGLGLESVPRFVVNQGSPAASLLPSQSETVFAVRSLDDAVGRMIEAVEENSAFREMTTKSSG